MVSAEDIRRRVEDADRAHIAKRADAAADVGAALENLDAAERAVEAHTRASPVRSRKQPRS